ncbi:hypothetical protein BYT27DRAFT_7207411 [Phlegmacium glaucopus]|nr:hypothetical protein BYT27DRAFT_7207411 [Phlegmacium glaucopus]
MPSKNRRRRREQESTTIASQAAPQSHLIQAPPPPSNANERAGSSYSLLESRNVVIHDGQFNQIRGHHTNLVINLNHSETTSGSLPGSPSGSAPSNETDPINPAPSSGQTLKHQRNQPQVSSQSQEIPLQKSNDIYERHLTPKGRGFPLWIPQPNHRLDPDYRRTGIRIGDVGIITHSGAFSFLFNICLPHDDPVNPQMLPERFAPISPPISPTDIEGFAVFMTGSHLASASIEKTQTSVDTSIALSGIVFESSASEGAILTMPQGARSEDLGNYARFRDYAAANIDDWYKFVNGPRGREAKNGDVRLVTGFDKTTSWGIATFSNQTRHDFRLRFGPSEGAGFYAWEYSGAAAEVRAGPDSSENDELRRDSDPPDVQFENQCLFVRTLNITLADDVWVDIHSSLGSVHVDPRHSHYPHVRDYSDSNNPHSNDPGTSSGSSSLPSQGVQPRMQRTAGSLYGLQDADVTNNNPAMFISGPLESLVGVVSQRSHLSKVLNDILLAKVPTAKMAITHDDDWQVEQLFFVLSLLMFCLVV